MRDGTAHDAAFSDIRYAAKVKQIDVAQTHAVADRHRLDGFDLRLERTSPEATPFQMALGKALEVLDLPGPCHDGLGLANGWRSPNKDGTRKQIGVEKGTDLIRCDVIGCHSWSPH